MLHQRAPLFSVHKQNCQFSIHWNISSRAILIIRQANTRESFRFFMKREVHSHGCLERFLNLSNHLLPDRIISQLLVKFIWQSSKILNRMNSSDEIGLNNYHQIWDIMVDRYLPSSRLVTSYFDQGSIFATLNDRTLIRILSQTNYQSSQRGMQEVQ